MKCTSCGKDKPLSEFRKNKNFVKRDGVSYQCKSCDTQGKRTSEGHMMKIYHSLRYNNQQRNLGSVDFSKPDFMAWCSKNGFNGLYQKWKDSNWDASLAPSVDRKDDSKPYAFDNMKLTTWGVNHGNNTTAMSKSVQQLKDGKVVKTFSSVREAGRSFSSKSTGSGIVYALGKSGRKAYGFEWRYKP